MLYLYLYGRTKTLTSVFDACGDECRECESLYSNDVDSKEREDAEWPEETWGDIESGRGMPLH